MEGWELDLVAFRRICRSLGQTAWIRLNPVLRMIARPARPELLPGVSVFGGLLAVGVLHLMWWSATPLGLGPGTLAAAGFGLMAATVLGVELLRPVVTVRRYWPLLTASVWLAGLACVLNSLTRHPGATFGLLILSGLSGEWIRQELSPGPVRRWIASCLTTLPPLLRRLADRFDRASPADQRVSGTAVEQSFRKPRLRVTDLGDMAWFNATSHLATPDVDSPVETTHGETEILQLRRVVEPGGEERVIGSLRIEFAAGQSLAIAHLPFAPLLRLTPQVRATVAAGEPARVKTCVAYPYGIRLELKRTVPERSPLSVRVEIVAVATAPPARVA